MKAALLAIACMTILCDAASAQVATQQMNRLASADEFKVGRFSLAYARPVKQVVKAPLLTDLSKPDVDLRPSINNFKLKIRDQGNTRNTCSVHALTFLIEYEYARQNLGLVTNDLSEEYLNYVTNLATGNTNDGDFFFNINKGHQKYGHAMQAQVANKSFFDPNFKVSQDLLNAGAKNWPRLVANIIKENANFTTNTADDAQPFGLTSAQFDYILAQLEADRPVAVGLRWPPKEKYATETVLGVELLKHLPASDLTADHSVALVGYRKYKGYPGGGYFIIRNSWGDDYGNKGYGYLSFEYVKAHAADAMTYK
jgi:hypothetical protein